MTLSKLKVLIIEDSVYKAMDITRALEFSGVRDITRVREFVSGDIAESKRNIKKGSKIML